LGHRLLDRLADEKADVLGHQLKRVDDTSWPHYLYEMARPEFEQYWEKNTRRRDAKAVLSLFGSGSFWTREAFTAVAACEEPFPIYLEIYLPTRAHHLGFRVRDFRDQSRFVYNLDDRTDEID